MDKFREILSSEAEIQDMLKRRITALEHYLAEEVIKRGRRGEVSAREYEIRNLLSAFEIYSKNSNDMQKIGEVLEELQPRFNKIIDDEEIK